MSSSDCSPKAVQEYFRSLLSDPAPSNSSTTPQRLTTSTTPQPLTSPPAKNFIRFIENDQNNRREKYDGHRWRLVCTWNMFQCTNIAFSYQLCAKHNAQRRNKELPKKKRNPLLTHSSLPIMNRHKPSNPPDDDDDDIEILEEYCRNPTIRRSMNSHIKAETHDFNVFSVEHLNEMDFPDAVKSEPGASSNYRSASSSHRGASSSHRSATNGDVEYMGSTARANGLNVTELISKNIPPLTDFEEDFIATRLMARVPQTCLMLDAQLFLHKEAMAVVKQNYRIKMDTISPDYFYDFLLRHPPVAIHYRNWFSRCKREPPTTGCPIDRKVWTLCMAVRGAAMSSDNMNDEYAD